MIAHSIPPSYNSTMKVRSYRNSDREAALRIWREVGWIEDDFPKEEAVLRFIQNGRATVAEIHGEPEAIATTLSGDIQLCGNRIPFAGLTSVTAGRVARKSGAAGAATAHVLAEEADAGAAAAGLSMFEQGYYNRLGFGTGSYEHFFSFDPATLKVPVGDRIPVRLDPQEFERIHAARLMRTRPFGSISLSSPSITELAIAECKNGFGLGFYEKHELTHLFWASSKGEYGPYRIFFMAYRSWEQFIELLGVLRRLGDQVRLVKMVEPPFFQVQDLLEKPFTRQTITQGGKYENSIAAEAFWQLRILDLQRCIRALTFPRATQVRFTLALEDPISAYLSGREGWRGIGGEYTITLGPESEVESGAAADLPRVKATVGAFSRLMFGVLPASSLAVTDQLQATPELLRQLDATIRLPIPHFDWLF